MRTPNQHCIINYMGRKPKKEHVHGYARLSHVALHLKQTHTLYNTVSQLYTNTKHKLQEENADSIPLGL